MSLPRRRGRRMLPLAHRQSAICEGCGKTVVQDNNNPRVWFDYNNTTNCTFGASGKQHRPARVR